MQIDIIRLRLSIINLKGHRSEFHLSKQCRPCCSMFCCPLLYVHPSFAIILIGKRAGCFAYFVFLVSSDCCVALPRDAMGLSAVCDRGIS